MSRRRLDSTLPYSKACDLQGDQVQLQSFLEIVDRYPEALAGQHAIRRWEYAVALRAIDGWQEQHDLRWAEQPAIRDVAQGAGGPIEICDVGGAGSNFWQVLMSVARPPILVVDASAPDRVWRDGEPVQYWSESVEAFAAHASHDQFDFLTCISVLEHVKDVRPFLRACRMLLKPGGLLFLTMDYWDAEGPDVAHFHWMRERIYNADRMRKLLMDLRELGYASFGQADWSYHGHQLYDYSVASLAVVKKEIR